MRCPSPRPFLAALRIRMLAAVILAAALTLAPIASGGVCHPPSLPLALARAAGGWRSRLSESIRMGFIVKFVAQLHGFPCGRQMVK
jgi:hypothetical protein